MLLVIRSAASLRTSGGVSFIKARKASSMPLPTLPFSRRCWSTELYSKVVDEGRSGVSWVMVQITLPTQQEWIRHARTYYDSLSPSTADGCGSLNRGVTSGRTTTLGTSH